MKMTSAVLAPAESVLAVAVGFVVVVSNLDAGVPAVAS